jgi:hypothetical protein
MTRLSEEHIKRNGKGRKGGIVVAEFQVGDRVRCIEEGSWGLEVSKEYLVKYADKEFVRLNGLANLYFNHRFELVGEREVTKVSELNVGRKDDSGKLRYDLITTKALEGLAAALTDGANIYGDENWRKVPNLKGRYYAAAQRHLQAWRKGEKKDKKSGLHPLAHALACIMFLLEADEDS